MLIHLNYKTYQWLDLKKIIIFRLRRIYEGTVLVKLFFSKKINNQAEP
jgi:hypothetical protein